MPVPDTNTFSLQDVVDEISPTSDDLSTCIAEANAAYWDTTYVTLPATKLSDFRNYGPALVCSGKYSFDPNSGEETLSGGVFDALDVATHVRINRVNSNTYGSSSSNYLRYNGVDIALNQDVSVEIPILDIENGDLVCAVYSGPNGPCTGSGVTTYTFQIEFSTVSPNNSYNYCTRGVVDECW